MNLLFASLLLRDHNSELSFIFFPMIQKSDLEFLYRKSEIFLRDSPDVSGVYQWGKNSLDFPRVMFPLVQVTDEAACDEARQMNWNFRERWIRLTV